MSSDTGSHTHTLTANVALMRFANLVRIPCARGHPQKTSAREGEAGQAEAETCGHWGKGVKQKWTSTFGSKFKYLIARSR